MKFLLVLCNFLVLSLFVLHTNRRNKLEDGRTSLKKGKTKMALKNVVSSDCRASGWCKPFII